MLTPTTDRLDCATCAVRERAACAALSGAERRELARIGRRRTLRKGEAIFAAGEDNGSCATLISGALKIASYGADGTERILSLVHPAGFVGEMFTAIAHHDVVALADSELCLFNRDQYEAAVDRFPALAKALLRRSGEDLFEARSLVELQARRSSKARVAGFLLAMADAASHSPCHPAEAFDLPLSRGEMAGLLGLTIETVSRQLTALERDGAIVRDGARGIRIKDAARLRALAD
ncbi:Crp/Fnr family transcriptional regulator [Sphingomonas sp.]|uniref:Crp/Fnr family transcriptional regulator n=1 Tax=Sphingomonas sp. TaxID=28214 RepID=UPI00286A4F03|nr:Crp/Fnr family transcriptional regulator [Sphingomonas sp.]